ncbi:hypothetical protein HG531_004722 [Fusarium graminearum]|nr:hypothetical protein HG531_004722 [Fusarium graminearum]
MPSTKSNMPYGYYERKYKRQLADAIRISFDNLPTSTFYRSGSIVRGTVKLKKDVFFYSTSLSINLICYATVERDYPDKARHRLLNLDMQIARSTFPDTKIETWDGLFPGSYPTYTIPFSFALQRHEGCSHDVNNEQIPMLHSCLPPTMTGLGKDARRAMIPEGVRIDYTVIAMLRWHYKVERMTEQEINFLPRFIEPPLLKVQDMGDIFKMKTTQQLKSEFFSKSTGHITLSTDPPTTLTLPIGGASLPPIDINALLHLEFSKGKPILPQSCILSAKLEPQTWSQLVPMQQLPEIQGIQETKNCRSVSEVLAKNTEMKLVWEVDGPEETKTATSPSAKSFTAQIKTLLPTFSKPERSFLPTFYSCLIARTYLLHVTIIIASVPLRLVLPLQLSVEDEEPAGQGESSGIEASGSDALYSPLFPRLGGTLINNMAFESMRYQPSKLSTPSPHKVGYTYPSYI